MRRAVLIVAAWIFAAGGLAACRARGTLEPMGSGGAGGTVTSGQGGAAGAITGGAGTGALGGAGGAPATDTAPEGNSRPRTTSRFKTMRKWRVDMAASEWQTKGVSDAWGEDGLELTRDRG
jgi:hypothetical protein